MCTKVGTFIAYVVFVTSWICCYFTLCVYIFVWEVGKASLDTFACHCIPHLLNFVRRTTVGMNVCVFLNIVISVINILVCLHFVLQYNCSVCVLQAFQLEIVEGGGQK